MRDGQSSLLSADHALADSAWGRWAYAPCGLIVAGSLRVSGAVLGRSVCAHG